MQRVHMQKERQARGLTRNDVAQLIGVHPNAIQRWENGEADPLSKNLIKLSELYMCSPEYLLDLTDDKRGTFPVQADR